MANTKNQMLVDLELVDQIIGRLENLITHYEHELLWERESYSDEDYLGMAENYGLTKKIIENLEINKPKE